MNKKRYTRKELREAIEEYFLKITRIAPVTEDVPTGEKDQYGHEITEKRQCFNQLGEPMQKLEYLIPPSCGALCRYLGISRDTWAKYQKDKALKAICEDARERIRLWNEEELLTRSGKNVKGIIFNLQNNFQYAEKTEVELGEKTRSKLTTEEKEALLKSFCGVVKGEEGRGAGA